jgi:hypothetical protein
LRTLTCLLLAAATAAPLAAGAPSKPLIKRGAYLTGIMGCHDCHTPMKMGPKGPEPDMSRMLSGHPEGLKMPPAPALQAPWGWAGSLTMTAFAGPWGVSYVPNLTPDKATGVLADVSEKEFIAAMRTGRHLGKGRPILPPMPWQVIGGATDTDLKALYAYLKSIPAISNKVPEPLDPPAPPKP